MSPIQSTRNYIGHVDVDETVQFLRESQEVAENALSPARALFDDSEARRIAGQLMAAFVAAENLYAEAVAERERISNDRVTRPQLLHEQLMAFREEYQRRAKENNEQILALSEQLRAALREEALPRSAGPSETLLARQEIEAAVRADGQRDPGDREGMHELFQRIADQGGELAAVATSGWGRSIFVAHAGSEVGFDTIIDAAGRSSLNGSDEGPKRAAEALAAVGSIPEAIAKVNFALEMAGEMLLVSPGNLS